MSQVTAQRENPVTNFVMMLNGDELGKQFKTERTYVSSGGKFWFQHVELHIKIIFKRCDDRSGFGASVTLKRAGHKRSVW